MWSLLYGALSVMGATRTNPVLPETAISEFIGHTIFGAIAVV